MEKTAGDPRNNSYPPCPNMFSYNSFCFGHYWTSPKHRPIHRNTILALRFVKHMQRHVHLHIKKNFATHRGKRKFRQDKSQYTTETENTQNKPPIDMDDRTSHKKHPSLFSSAPVKLPTLARSRTFPMLKMSLTMALPVYSPSGVGDTSSSNLHGISYKQTKIYRVYNMIKYNKLFYAPFHDYHTSTTSTTTPPSPSTASTLHKTKKRMNPR